MIHLFLCCSRSKSRPSLNSCTNFHVYAHYVLEIQANTWKSEILQVKSIITSELLTMGVQTYEMVGTPRALLETLIAKYRYALQASPWLYHSCSICAFLVAQEHGFAQHVWVVCMSCMYIWVTDPGMIVSATDIHERIIQTYAFMQVYIHTHIPPTYKHTPTLYMHTYSYLHTKYRDVHTLTHARMHTPTWSIHITHTHTHSRAKLAPTQPTSWTSHTKIPRIRNHTHPWRQPYKRPCLVKKASIPIGKIMCLRCARVYMWLYYSFFQNKRKRFLLRFLQLLTP
jgi:hypothetical protein